MSYSNLLAELRAVGEATTLRKKSHLAFQGEVPRYGFYILDGAVKAYVITSEGSQAVVDIYAKHSILPLAWLNKTASTALFYYEAITDVRAIRFTRAQFEQALSARQEAREDYRMYLAEAHTSLLFRATGLSQSSSTHKICYALYLLLLRYGVEQPDGTTLIPIPLTHEVIASLIGQSRENTAKTIKKLSDEGILSYASKLYTVNQLRLEHYLGEDSFRDVVSS